MLALRGPPEACWGSWDWTTPWRRAHGVDLVAAELGSGLAAVGGTTVLTPEGRRIHDDRWASTEDLVKRG